MTDRVRHPEAEADAAADRISFLFVLLMLAVSLIVNAASTSFELRQDGTEAGLEPWLRELASHLALLAVVPLVPWALSRWPVRVDSARSALPGHVLATGVFAGVHILLMVYLRKFSYPILLDQQYEFGLAQPDIWLYEYRKDAFTYLILMLGYLSNRAATQNAREAESARAAARAGGRLTLRCGGRTYFIDANDVIAARAASNYVEVETAGKVYLARMTLTDLERLLEDAGTPHVRVHRSHLVHRHRIIEIAPTGQGDVTVTLDTGAKVPGSRRYRMRLDTSPL